MVLQESDEQLARIPSSFTKSTICESVLKVLVEALMAIREEIRLLSNADAVAAAGLLPTQSAEKAHATGIEKVSSISSLSLTLPLLLTH